MARNIEKLNSLISEYQSVRALAQEAKAEQDLLAGAIRELLEVEGLEEYVAPTGRCIYREVVSYPIDTRALKAELPTVAERYSIARTTRPLKIA